MVHKLLFESSFGEWLLTQLEKRVGVAVVPVNWLDDQIVSPPAGWQPGGESENTRGNLAAEGVCTQPGATDKAATQGGVPGSR
jgi:hypothetical protein